MKADIIRGNHIYETLSSFFSSHSLLLGINMTTLFISLSSSLRRREKPPHEKRVCCWSRHCSAEFTLYWSWMWKFTLLSGGNSQKKGISLSSFQWHLQFIIETQKSTGHVTYFIKLSLAHSHPLLLNSSTMRYSNRKIIESYFLYPSCRKIKFWIRAVYWLLPKGKTKRIIINASIKSVIREPSPFLTFFFDGVVSCPERERESIVEAVNELLRHLKPFNV